MRIGTRIYASIATLLALFLLAVGIACIGLLQLKDNVARYAEADQLATLVDRIDRDIIELQRDVLVFAALGNASAPERVKRVGKSLRDQIDKAMLFPNDDETSYRLAEMKVRLANYLENFPTVIRERETRQSLVGQRLRQLESETPPAFERLRQLVAGTDESDSAAAADAIVVERAMSLVALAQLQALRFFDDPDVASVRESLALLADAQDELSSVSFDRDEETALCAEEVIGSIEAYESAFLRAVQATRGYLSLVNVVMAGEAAEFLYQSQQIQKRSAEQSRHISSETVSRAGRSTVAAIGFAVAALLVALLVTWLVVRGIINPISAMTMTFSQLMQGQNDATIPGLDRADEIGDMARAADMFRDRNRQTEELLTQSRQLAHELDENAKELARSNEDLNSFAYVASHDLRSPLRAIDNISSWIEEDVGESIPVDSREHLSELRRRVRRMEQLLNELLEYSRVGQGNAAVADTDVGALFREMTDLLDMPPDAKLIVDHAMPTILVDRGSLSRVILNLLSNAIKYRAERPLEIRCECHIVGQIATFKITDNGIGIAPEYQSRIFEMFKRLHRESEIEGTGMGLAMVRKIVRQNGCDIQVQSTVDQGSCFTFTWPIGAQANTEQASETLSNTL